MNLVVVMLLRNTTASWLALLPPLSQLLRCLYLLCYRRRQLDQAHVQMSPRIGGKVRQWWVLFDLSLRHQYQLLHGSLMQRCCCMLPRCWDLGHWHYWEQWCCCWLESLGLCLHCCCCLTFQGRKRRKMSELGPEVGPDYCLDAGWGAGAAAACQSNPPEAGGGSSCEHCGTWFCRTSWSEERGKRKDRIKMKAWKSKPSVGSPWSPTQARFVLELPLVTTGPTHLPHSLQGKKLANEGIGTTSSSANGLFTGWQVGVIYENRTNCKLTCFDPQPFHGFNSLNYANTPYSFLHEAHYCILFVSICFYYMRLIWRGSECMTQWSPQSITGID